MLNPEYLLENDMHKIDCDFALQTDRLTPTKRSVLEIINRNENLPDHELYRPGGPQSKIKGNEKVLTPCQRTKKQTK